MLKVEKLEAGYGKKQVLLGIDLEASGGKITAIIGPKWVRGRLSPAPPRYRNGVNSPYLPACGFPAPGGPHSVAQQGA
jgi:hypothetical protein